RSRSEKFRSGYIPKSGDPAMKYVKKAVAHVQLKPGIFGIQVFIVQPNVKFPDEIEIPEEKEGETVAEGEESES
ncbi:MAG: 30S ribosomal protein S3, partial [Candidatus Bathyarchaeia archaeon]